jgi:tetratricopeptide (TPR) repeat protein
MDCRKTLWLALSLTAGLSGCQHLGPKTAGETAQTPEASPPPAVSSYAASKASAKKNKRPEHCVAFGQFEAGEAARPDLTPGQREAMYEIARRAYQEALEIDPKYVPAHLELGRLFITMQDMPRAVAAYQKGLQVAPQNAALWYELGVCHNYRKDWADSVRCLSRACQLDRDNRNYLNTQAVVMARAGRYAESLESFRLANPEAVAHYKLARTLQHLDQPALSRQHLELALKIDPRLEQAQGMYAELAGPPVPQPQAVASTAPVPMSPPPAAAAQQAVAPPAPGVIQTVNMIQSSAPVPAAPDVQPAVVEQPAGEAQPPGTVRPAVYLPQPGDPPASAAEPAVLRQPAGTPIPLPPMPPLNLQTPPVAPATPATPATPAAEATPLPAPTAAPTPAPDVAQPFLPWEK